MAFDFPDAPVAGDIYQKYSFDGTVWIAIGGDFIAKTGDTMEGPLVLAADPAQDLEAATKEYVDNAVGTSEYVLKTGDTMMGPLVLALSPTQDMEAATKEYVDSIITIGDTPPTNPLPEALWWNSDTGN